MPVLVKHPSRGIGENDEPVAAKVCLLAPTGRAAKVFSAYAGHSAFTIHKKIYRQQSFSNEISNFSINDNLATNTLLLLMRLR